MPKPTPEQIQFKAYLEALVTAQQLGMEPADRQEFLDNLTDIQNLYMTARTEADRKDLTEKERKEYDRIFKALAGSVGGITRGTLSAAQAFTKGDNLAGAVAVLDICASIIPLFDLAGPEGTAVGMLVGALFSCIGQILSCFAPKQPSLEEKIQRMLDHAQSEEQIRELAAVGHTINIYARDLKKKCMGTHTYENNVLAGTVALSRNGEEIYGTGTSFTTLDVGQWLVFDSDSFHQPYRIKSIASDSALTLDPAYRGSPAHAATVQHFSRKTIKRGIDEILEMPLDTEAQADEFEVEMVALQLGLVRTQARTAIADFNIWTVAGYLERAENQGKEGWPEVLGTWCNIYGDLLHANVMLKSLATPQKVREQRSKVEPGVKDSPLPQETRTKCHDLLIELEGLTNDLSEAWDSDNVEALKTLKAVTPAARHHGLYLCKAFWQGTGGYVLYTAVANNSDKTLNWDYKKNTGWLKPPSGGSFSVVLPREQANSFTPRYELFLFEDFRPRITRYSLDSVTGALGGGQTLLQDNFQYTNWGGDGSWRRFENCTDAWALADASDPNPALPPIGFRIYTAHDTGTFGYVNVHTLSPDGNVWRLNWEPGTAAGLTHIRAAFLPPSALPDDPDRTGLPPGLCEVLYGGYRNRPNIWVELFNNWGEVPSPWDNYNGIEVDPYFLWVFGSEGLACATHASVVRCKKSEISQPNWITYTFGWADGFNVRSLSPCADGILAMSSLQANRDVLTPTYEVRLTEHSIVCEGRLWPRGADADQILKMPIPCWSVLQSLRASLELEQFSRGAGA